MKRRGRNGIEASKSTIDKYSKFKMVEQEPMMMKVAFIADNGKYLSRISRGKKNPVEASKSFAGLK